MEDEKWKKEAKEASEKRLLELAAMWEQKRAELGPEGRCIDGSYFTPYCKCNRECYRFYTTLEGYPREVLPIWLASCRQSRQSHCFDFDDFIYGDDKFIMTGTIVPLSPQSSFDGDAESMMELANRAI